MGAADAVLRGDFCHLGPGTYRCVALIFSVGLLRFSFPALVGADHGESRLVAVEFVLIELVGPCRYVAARGRSVDWVTAPAAFLEREGVV